MSLETTTDRVSFAGNGATVAFAFPYKFFAEADLVVILKNNTTGVETIKTLTTHYTTSGVGTEIGGTVTMLTAPATGETLIILRDKSAIQELELDDNGKIPSENLEKQLDKLLMMIQRNKNLLGRTVRLPEGFIASFETKLPALMVNNGHLKTKSDGSGWEYITTADLINTVTAGAQLFTASRAIVSDGTGLAVVSATTAAEIAFISGLTSAVQTQLDAKIAKSTATTKGDILVATGASTVVRKGVGSNNQYMAAASGQTDGLEWRNFLAPVPQRFASGSGNYNMTYVFSITSGNATIGATYTNNAITYTVAATIAAGVLLYATGNGDPAVSGTLTKASGTGDATLTFQAFRKPIALIVEFKGAGGGGSGSGTASASSNGTSGGTTTFGSSLLTATGGAGGVWAGAGGGGGTVTINAPAIALESVAGQVGGGNQYQNIATIAFAGAAGGGNGAGAGASGGVAGNAAAVNSGGGGSGGGNGLVTNCYAGSGGGEGGKGKALIPSPASTYAYAVGALGAKGAAGTSGFAGGDSGSGHISVLELFQ